MSEPTIPIGYMTIKQSATYCSLSVSTLRNLIRAGDLAAFKPSPRRILVSVGSIDRFLGKYKMYQGVANG
jgi:excisionase family DNA binding protein